MGWIQTVQDFCGLSDSRVPYHVSYLVALGAEVCDLGSSSVRTRLTQCDNKDEETRTPGLELDLDNRKVRRRGRG